MDNRRASDAQRSNVAAGETCSDRCGDVPLPNHRASGGVERINVIRLGDGDYHWALLTALDVKWLRVNIANNRAVEIHVTCKVCCG